MIGRFRMAILLAALTAWGCGGGDDRNANTAPVPADTPTPVAPSTGSSVPSPSPITSGEKIVTPRVFSFEGGKIPEGWQWLDPGPSAVATEYEAKAGSFKMKINTGRDMYGENRTAPRLVKAIAGDFQIETRLRFDPKRDYQGAGLIAIASENDYLRFERAFGGVNDGGSGIRLDACVKGDYSPITTPGEVPTDAVEVDLKLVRRANVFTAYWRLDENSEWREAEEFESAFPENVLVGIIGCNTSDPIYAEFKYIRLLPQKVERPF